MQVTYICICICIYIYVYMNRDASIVGIQNQGLLNQPTLTVTKPGKLPCHGRHPSLSTGCQGEVASAASGPLRA